MIHPSYKRPHYYLIFFVIVVILTAGYVIGLTDIFDKNHPQNPENISAPSPSSVSSTTTKTTDKVVTKIFGSPVTGDIGAGTGTIVAFVTQEGGGSGTFFYAVAFVKQGTNSYSNTNPIFLGDRIAPQNLNIASGTAVFNYCVRKENEPFTTPPSVCVSKYVSIKNGVLVDTK